MWSVLNSLLFFGLLATFASAAPSRLQKRSFKVERVRNVNFQGHNGPRELLKVYSKFSMPIPEALLNSIQAEAAKAQAESFAAASAEKGDDVVVESVEIIPANSDAAAAPKNSAAKKPSGIAAGTNSTGRAAGVGLVTATPEAGDVEYLSPVNVGGQTLNLDFDSGSSDLWVFSTMLPQNVQQGHVNFDPAKSQTFKAMQGATFQISYGDGSQAAGVVGTETVDIGGVSVTNQAVEMATQVSGSFIKDTANNGLVGLAFSKLNAVKPQKQKTFFDNVMPSLAEPVFTADLRKGTPGAYEFGRIDTSKFTGQMNFIPVNTTRGFWQFSSESFAVGANGKVQQGTPGGQAIADTGTTLILANPATINGYYSQVQGAKNDQNVGGITVPCDANMPDLMLDVGGVMAKVKGSDIVFAKVQGNTCFGGMQPTTSNLQIYGDIFFKSQFVVFNGGNNTLGIADHAV